MIILSQRNDELLSGSEVWFVRPDHIEDVFRVCVTPSRNSPPAGKRFGVVMATDAELSAGALTSTIKSCSMDLICLSFMP